MNVGIVLAGGVGTRVGGDLPKQFIEVRGKPVLAYTLDNFQHSADIDAIEIVYNHSWLNEVQAIVKRYEYRKVKWLTPGGDTFQYSVMAGIDNLKGRIAADDIAVISFGVSPMTTGDIIEDSIRVCRKHGNAVAAEDITLCTCIKDDECSTTQNIIREQLKGFSNPWTFRFGELCGAYEEGQRRGILDEIEPHTTSLYLALGKRIWFSKSNGYNFKITTREDLAKFEGLLLLRESRKRGTDAYRDHDREMNDKYDKDGTGRQ